MSEPTLISLSGTSADFSSSSTELAATNTANTTISLSNTPFTYTDVVIGAGTVAIGGTFSYGSEEDVYGTSVGAITTEAQVGLNGESGASFINTTLDYNDSYLNLNTGSNGIDVVAIKGEIDVWGNNTGAQVGPFASEQVFAGGEDSLGTFTGTQQLQGKSIDEYCLGGAGGQFVLAGGDAESSTYSTYAHLSEQAGATVSNALFETGSKGVVALGATFINGKLESGSTVSIQSGAITQGILTIDSEATVSIPYANLATMGSAPSVGAKLVLTNNLIPNPSQMFTFASNTLTIDGVTITGGAAGDVVELTSLAGGFEITAPGTFNLATAAITQTISLEGHTGDTLAGNGTITNAANTGENLDFSGIASPNVWANGISATGLSPGSSDIFTVGMVSTIGSGGVETGTVVFSLVSDGTGIAGDSGTTALSPQTVTETGTFFNYATASMTSTIINVGTVTAGQNFSAAVGFTNAGIADGDTENLDISAMTSFGILQGGTITGLGAGASGTLQSIFEIDSLGNFVIVETFDAISDGAGIDNLGTTSLGEEVVTIVGTAVTAPPPPPPPAYTITTNPVTIIGSIDAYSQFITNGNTWGGAVYGPAGTDFNVVAQALITSPNSYPDAVGIVLGSAGTVANNGTISDGGGIAVLGGTSGAYVANYNELVATTGTGIFLQADGSGLNLGTLAAAGVGINLNGGGYGYNSGTINAGTGIVDGYSSGNYVYNSGTITATDDGVDSRAGLVINAGTITACATGQYMTSGDNYNYGKITAAIGLDISNVGYIYNAGTLITNAYGINLTSGLAVNLTSGLAVNMGAINAGTGVGINLAAGGVAYNYGTITGANGIISGSNDYAYIYNAGQVTVTNTGVTLEAGLFSNAGTIEAGTNGVVLGNAVVAYNYGLISGGSIGVAAGAGTTLYDTGSISGGSYAISFTGAGDLIMDAYAAANTSGTVQGDGGTLELLAGSQVGTIDLNQFEGFSTIIVPQGADWVVAGGSVGTMVNDGLVTVDDATIGSVIGVGAIKIKDPSLTLANSVASRETIRFSGTGETLALGDAADFKGIIAGFTTGDTINLAGISPADITATCFVGGALTLTAGTLAKGSVSVTLTFANASKDMFGLFADGDGTGITLASAKPSDAWVASAAGTTIPASAGIISSLYPPPTPMHQASLMTLSAA